MLQYIKIRDRFMAFKLFGATDFAMGSYNYYKTKKSLNEINLTQEEADANLNYNATKATLGAVRFVSLGWLANTSYNTLAGGVPLDAINTGLLVTFAATYVIEGIIKMYPNLLEDESINYKRFQGKILKDNDIFNTLSKETELPVESSYQLFMFGNKLATSHFVDKAIFAIKNKITEMQSNWDAKDYNKLNKLEKFVNKIISKSQTLTEYVSKKSDKARLKMESNAAIKAHSDWNSRENEHFRVMIKETEPTKIRNEKYNMDELQKINQKAIIKAYDIIRKQNIELFFARVIIDYNNGIKHTDIINKFVDLHTRTLLPAKNTQDEIFIESYKKISSLAFKMSKNEKIYPDNTDLKTILTTINPNITQNKKLVLYSFDDVFSYTKRKLIDKQRNTANLNNNIYKDNKVNISNEIEFDMASFKEVIKIKESKLKKAEQLDVTKNKKKI